MLGIFLDQETTGLDPSRHRVLEIAIKLLDLANGDLLGEFSSIVKQPQQVWEKSDPISLSVNGFRWSDLDDGQSEQAVNKQIITLFTQVGIQRHNAFFLCQNPAFDRAFFAQLVDIYTQEQLQWPYHWLDFASMYWALFVREVSQKQLEWPSELSLSKDEIAKRYGLPPEVRPHRAMNGVDHLLRCYQRVVGWGAPKLAITD